MSIVSDHPDAPAIGDTRLLIGSERLDSVSGAVIDVFNPATGELLTRRRGPRGRRPPRRVRRPPRLR